jgi:hypothetical protein
MSKRKHSEEKFSNETNKVCEFPPDSKSEELRLLVKDPAYVCADCGRSAASHENLCRPDKLFSTW